MAKLAFHTVSKIKNICINHNNVSHYNNIILFGAVLVSASVHYSQLVYRENTPHPAGLQEALTVV